MNKEEFNALTIEDQVEYINVQLALVSLNRIATSIGISESTIRDRFKSNGYKRQGKSFIKLGTTEHIKEAVKPKKNTTTTINTKNTEQKQSNKNIKALENRIDSLEKELEQIKAILTTITTNTTTTVNTKTTKAIKTYKGDEVVRSYRINADVQKQFKVFCKTHSEYRVSDIISTVIENFLNEYNK